MNNTLYSIVKIDKKSAHKFSRTSLNKKMGIIQHNTLKEIEGRYKIIFTGEQSQIVNYILLNQSKWVPKRRAGTPVNKPHVEIPWKTIIISTLTAASMGAASYWHLFHF